MIAIGNYACAGRCSVAFIFYADMFKCIIIIEITFNIYVK